MKTSAPTAVLQKSNISVTDQIINLLKNSKEELADIKFGSVLVEFRNGTPYKVLISKSILIKE